MKLSLTITLILLCFSVQPARAKQSRNSFFEHGSLNIGALNWRGMATGFRGGATYEPMLLQRSADKNLSQTKLGFYADVLGVEGSHLFDPPASTHLISSIFSVGGGFHLTHSQGRFVASIGLGHYSLTHRLTQHQYQNALLSSRRSGWGTRYAIGTGIGRGRLDHLQLSVTQLPRLQDERRGNNMIIGLDFIHRHR
ncbi:hypothetical protein [Armatimonas sp.]|uniref:hypothetical protein n=1 Tax=Armatimonas sp. TaxID=1872638 RepID=UPI00286C3C0B|nr:hypothetical protein [Armatimonas sp.]